MELTPRKQAVLKAIVKAYIETGEPIGSKNLMLLLNQPPSSATIRHEMSELCELGLLKQPHTSAGRIPTSKGYKLYVDSLMSAKEANRTLTNTIENTLLSSHAEPEAIPETAARVLSELTGLPAFACLITEKMPRIKRIELLTIGRFSKMLLVITDDGRTRNRIFRFGKDFTSSLEDTFNQLVEKRIKGKTADTLTKAYIQTVVTEAGIYALDLMPLFSAVCETAAEIEKDKVTFVGEERLYNICVEDTAGKISALISRKEPILSLLSSIKDETKVIFGSDTKYAELSGSSIIAADFNGSEKYKGYIGIIGSSRISYEQIIPCIEYTAQKLTKIMNEAQKDMEE